MSNANMDQQIAVILTAAEWLAVLRAHYSGAFVEPDIADYHAAMKIHFKIHKSLFDCKQRTDREGIEE